MFCKGVFSASIEGIESVTETSSGSAARHTVLRYEPAPVLNPGLAR
jgi:hypothetical protein